LGEYNDNIDDMKKILEKMTDVITLDGEMKKDEKRILFEKVKNLSLKCEKLESKKMSSDMFVDAYGNLVDLRGEEESLINEQSNGRGRR